MPPRTDARDEAGAETTQAPGPENSFRDNQQRVDRGMAFMGGVEGDVFFLAGAESLDEAVTERILKPRLREGPYPAAEVRERLDVFVEPPTYTRCRKALDSHVLVVRARGRTGVSTTAFALLAERYGVDGITGLDPLANLTTWRPKGSRGYLLQGLSQTAADPLNEVALRGLADLLRRSGAHLIITVAEGTVMVPDTEPWQVTHLPSLSGDVAAKRLRTMAETDKLTGPQMARALEHLASREFTDYLRAHPLPGDGADVAEGLREAAVSETSVGSVLEDLRVGSVSAARAALAESRHNADSLSLMAAVALLPRQDRTLIEQFTAVVRPLMLERAGPDQATGSQPERPDVLGQVFEDRLAAVGARLLTPEFGSGSRSRYPVQPVGFSGRHRSETLLRHLWLDYEGMAQLLWKALDSLPHQSGVDLTAGRAIGRALTYATGPSTLRQLVPFAAASTRWRRRLVAFALGEMVQHAALTGVVRDQLRQWSRARSGFVRCTVAETCAGSYGLARPAAALRLLDAVLDGPDTEAERSLRTAVAFALGALLTEEANHTIVFDKVAEWLASESGTRRHAVAAHVVESVSLSTFPQQGSTGAARLSLSDMLVDYPEEALRLVVLALDDPATYEATTKGLLLIEEDTDPRHRTDFASFLTALAGMAHRHRGVIRFMLRRHRTRTTGTDEGIAS
ncbi:hypothetical protein [Streptomyces sp. AK02-01A]|uniref:hypothetical protein n=1 Tax=Streptomyces sp. AK02-01A TaxID=3028648 RepID=UPI0029B9F01A|nr:hypothetical protein [Streptomyces sp. AK02-01A]MDX3851059.1 hypothetical protein [Streptomyces sp. AK02-01A]